LAYSPAMLNWQSYFYRQPTDCVFSGSSVTTSPQVCPHFMFVLPTVQNYKVRAASINAKFQQNQSTDSNSGMRRKQIIRWSQNYFLPLWMEDGVKVTKPPIKETWKLWWSEMLVTLFAWHTPAVSFCYQGCILWHCCLTCSSKLKTAIKMYTSKLWSNLHGIFIFLRLQVFAILLWNIFELYLVSNLLPSLLIKGTHIKTCKHL
jgi:hypothetical protein